MARMPGRVCVKSYYRVMLGKKSAYATECFAGGFIGADYEIGQDLSGSLPDAWREFNKAFIPVWLAGHPGKGKIAAGLSCGFLWTVAKGIAKGDIVLCPDGSGRYHVGEVSGDYFYVPDGPLPHRRLVHWLSATIDRSEMRDALRHSTGSVGTVSNISGYASEIEGFIGDAAPPVIVSNDPSVEDPSTFALEKHLEDFLVANWAHTELGKRYDIFELDGEKVGRQYPSDTGPIDILAVRKDKKELLVLELKRGRASDAVVGQVLRYMGYVQEELAEPGQTVRGVIIAFEDDVKLRRALAATPNVTFYRYEISFKLVAV